MRTQPPAAFESGSPVSSRLDDPLRYCIFATIVLIAWVITPALALVLFGGLGVSAYVRAYRRGVLRSRCYLRDTRLVIGYLAALTTLGIAATAWRVAGWLA